MTTPNPWKAFQDGTTVVVLSSVRQWQSGSTDEVRNSTKLVRYNTLKKLVPTVFQMPQLISYRFFIFLQRAFFKEKQIYYDAY